MQIFWKRACQEHRSVGGRRMILAVLPRPSETFDNLAAKVGKSWRASYRSGNSASLPACELGAMPPFASLHNLPCVRIVALAADSHAVRRLCSSGEPSYLFIRSKRGTHVLRFFFLVVCSNGLGAPRSFRLSDKAGNPVRCWVAI